MNVKFSKSTRIKAKVLLIVLVAEMLTPAVSFALTGGPSQPEVQSFEPVGTSEMVDVFSGDFNYNIPLLDVNGYPVNIAYHAGASMDEEASWVGLGWNINPGNIGRGMRGLPDDMNGEDVIKEFNVKDNWTFGLNASISGEIVGADLSKLGKALKKAGFDAGLNLGLKYNRYKGIGHSFGASLSHNIAKVSGLNAGLSMDYSDDGGLDISPNVSYSKTLEEQDGNALSSKFRIGTGINSRTGVKGLNMGASISNSTARSKVDGKDRGSIGRGSSNAGVTYSSALQSYTPSISSPMSTLSIDFSFKSGAEVFGITGDGMLRGSFSNQRIQDKDEEITKKGYGYMYEQEASQDNDPNNRDYLLDFNRENDGQLMQSTPFLPWVNHSFDMFSVSAQGVGGTYRLHRNDMPVLHDDYRDSKTYGFRAGVDIDFTQAVKGGGNLGFNYSKSESGAWLGNNLLQNKVGFVSKSKAEAFENEPQYEPVFFRDVNEVVPQNADYLANVGGEEMLRPEVRGHTLLGHLNKPNGTIKYNGSREDNASMDRTPRNKLLTYRKASEASFCLDFSIKSYPLNDLTFENGRLSPISTFTRDVIHNPNHISEIEVVNSDGSRHVFGIPAYNNTQIEKSFRVGSVGNSSTGLVPYSDNEASRNNKSGRDGMYSSTTTPAHAHSYLLTGVLSPDYVDLENDGITDDDLGSAVKINYSRVLQNYKWRTPYLEKKAKYAKGNNADSEDNMGSVVYGEKEIWYMHSIEGKTHIALFELSNRDDGLGVQDEDGGKNSSARLKKLDKIKLYSKREVKEFGLENAVPIKTVHFDYEYNLCRGIKNQIDETKGKLTLKKIYFTYGASNKGKLNSYKFDYNKESDTSGQYKYNLQSYDAWGTFSPVQYAPTNAEFPYTNQDYATAAEYASLWNLETIHLPSGGTINVQYEADSYGYVQDKRAMGMFKIKNFGKYSNDNNEDNGFDRSEALYGKGLDKETYDIVFFNLESPLPNSKWGRDELRKRYLNGIGEVQVMVNVEIAPNGASEYIKTYVQPSYSKKDGSNLIDCGITDAGEGWFRFDKVHIRDNNEGEMVNPIAKAGWQFTRMNLDFIINPSQNNDGSKSFNFSMVSSFVGMFNDLAGLITGPNRMLMTRKFCRVIYPNRSWVRLNDPDRTRYGGGHRVKSIKMSDNWESITTSTDPTSAEYGQEYDYTTIADSTESISSGVATFEPSPARDVNPFVVPVYYDQQRKGVPDSRYTFERPIGESFYPGASVGYSKVTVNSITHDGQSKNHRTGYQVSEFFTYKDFPTESYASDIDAEFPPDDFLSKFSFGDDYKQATAAQGFLVILNDMHGKPKANWSYNEYGDRLSGVEYTYKVDDNGKLDNTVLAMNKDNTFSEKTFGVNVDFATDSRRFKDKFFSADADINLDVFLAAVVPIFVPSIWPSIKQSESEVKTASTIKIVRKLGLLQTTTAYKEGSKIETENLLFDGSTGQTLLTSVDNEFGDKVYSFNYPAHWAYDEGMGQAFQNWGLELKGLKFNGGSPECSKSTLDLKDYVVPGDECILNRPGKYDHIKVWVTGDQYGNPMFIDAEGNHVYDYWPSAVTKTADEIYKDNNTTLRVMRSGRRNMASVSIGSVTCMKNPLVKDGSTWKLEFVEVLATSAVQYKDKWKTDMSLFATYDCDTIATDTMLGLLSKIDSLINDSFFYSTSLNADFLLNKCYSCPQGYAQSNSQNFCIKYDTIDAFLNDSLINVNTTTSTDGVYSSYGARIYEDFTDKELPIILGRDSSSFLIGKHKLFDANGDRIHKSQDLNGFWKNPYNSTSTVGRLNSVGVWSSEAKNNEWIGFTSCVTVEESKTYFMGFASDNKSRIKINGELISTFIRYENEHHFKTWHIIPVFLDEGTNYIEMEGLNEIGAASFGVEIYDATESQLASFTSEFQLESATVFSSKDRLGTHFDLGTTSGYSCPAGYALNLCGDSAACVSRDTTAIVTDCISSNDCPILLNTSNYPVKNILDILDYSHINQHTASLNAIVQNEFDEIDTIDLRLYSPCDTLFDCQTVCSYEARERKVNPYLTGIKGNWRPYKSWTYVDDRDYDKDRANPKEDGKFTIDQPFWKAPTASNVSFTPQPGADNKWVWTSEVTEYSPFGMELENMDPLGRYSAARYGYSQTLPTAVASNTRHRQLWYEGFEEYGYLNTLYDDILCPQLDMPYAMTFEEFVNTAPWLDKDISHTGNVSLRVDPADSLIQEIALNPNYVEFTPSNAHETYAYTAGLEDQIIPFRPTPGDYIASMWIREENLTGLDTSFYDSYMVIETEDDLGNKVRNELHPTGLIIEGWQRVEVKITIPNDAEVLRIKFKTDATKAWFDDFRIYPYNGSMKSYAYDDRTLRLMAELDENNYATYYEYDLEGNLIRIKKETIRGIKTLQESRQYQKSQP